MNKALSIIISIIAAVVCFAIGRGIGLWWADTLKSTGGMVTADDIIGYTYILPVVLAAIGAFIAYYLNRDKS